MLTLKEVAREAGVAPSSVSDILRQRSDPGARYTPATRRRVMEIAKRRGYRANMVAQSMVRGTTHSIGMIVPLGASVSETGTVRILAVVNEIQNAGYQIMIASKETGNSQQEQNLIENMLARRVDGLIIFNDVYCDPAYYESLRARNFPFVLMAPISRPAQITSVYFNSMHGMYQATRHLIELGHRHIVYAVDPETFLMSNHRAESFRQALQEAGLPIRRSLAIDPALPMREAIQIFTKDVLRETPRPTAIMYVNDTAAFIGLHTLLEMGLRVPEDISVVGFDDLPLAQLTWPELTTVRQSSEMYAREAVRLLLAQMRDPQNSEPQNVFLNAKFVARGSSGPAPGR